MIGLSQDQPRCDAHDVPSLRHQKGATSLAASSGSLKRCAAGAGLSNRGSKGSTHGDRTESTLATKRNPTLAKACRVNGASVVA